jgi:hypothetical protein
MAPTKEDFATIEDLEKFWRTLTQDENSRAQALIEMASNYLRQIAKNNKTDLDQIIIDEDDDIFKGSLKMIVLSAVKRAMLTPADAPPADEWSQSASPYSESMKFTNPSTDLYFKNNELKLIGLSSVTGRSKFGILRGVR